MFGRAGCLFCHLNGKSDANGNGKNRVMPEKFQPFIYIIVQHVLKISHQESNLASSSTPKLPRGMTFR